MAGYTRQSSSNIQPGEIVKSGPVNNEFNAIRDAFNKTSGHKHDGTTAEGAYIPEISDTDNYNKVVIDTTNNRIGFFSEVSSAAVEQVRIQDGAIVPVTDNDIDLGTSSLEFKDLFIDGTATIDTLTVDESATITANLTVNGNTTLGNAASDTVTLTADVASAITPSADNTHDLGAVGSEWRNLYVDGQALIDDLVADTADINGGNIDATVIGASTAAAGTFTDLTSSGTMTIATVDINGGAIDGVTIGGSSAGAGTFTTVTASGAVAINGGLTMDTNKFTVADTSGNTAIAGTLDVTGQTTVANLTATGTTVLPATSFGDANITNVGDIALDSISADGSTITITGNTTFADGSFDFNIASHDGTNGLALGGTVVTASAAELNKLKDVTSTTAEINILDGDTSATSTTVADADRVVLNDNGTMVQVAVTDLAAYFDDEITAMPNLVTTAATTVGALNSGSITSGFGTIDTGSSTITTTGAITGGSLVISDGGNIGSSSDTDAISIASGGNVTMTQDLTVTGNLTVNGSTSTISTTNTTIEDALIELGTGTSGTPSNDAGIVIERGSADNAFIGYDESADKFTVGTGSFTGASTGNLTITTGTLVANIEGNVTGNVSGSSGSTTGNAATATALATARDIGGVSFDGTGDINLPGVNTTGDQNTTGNAAGLTSMNTTVAELNVMDGDTSATSTTLADADRVVVNDAGTMKQVALTDFETYMETSLDTLSNVTTVGALDSGSITSGFGAINNGSSNITTSGTIQFGSLSDGTVTVTDIADEDNFSSNSATKLATQQSIKAYVDSTAGQANNVTNLTATGVELNTVADASGVSIDTSTAVAANDALLLYDNSGSSIGYFDVDLLDTYFSATTKTLTNKTLTNPIVSGLSLSDAGLTIEGSSANDHETVLNVTDPTADRTITLPDATGTVVTTGNLSAITSTGTLTSLTVDDITINGSTISDGADLTIDVGGDLIIDVDGADVKFKDGGTEFAHLFKSGNNFGIYSAISDGDIQFIGVDGVLGQVTALTLDMSEAGAATFNSTVTANAGVIVDNITIDGTQIDLSSGDLTIDVAGDIILDADGGDIIFADGGAYKLSIANSSGDVAFVNNSTDKDLIFKGYDGASLITALTLDMSDAGSAIFNNHVYISDSSKLQFGAASDLQIYHDTNNSIIEDAGTGALKLKGDDIRLEDASGNNIIKAVGSGSAELYEAGNKKLETTANGINVTGDVVVTNDIYVADQIIHEGDSDTYLQFHNANEFRIVTGGTEMLEVNDTTVQFGAAANLNGNNLTNVEDIYLRDKIFHDGNTDTRIGFAINEIQFSVDGEQEMKITTGGVFLDNAALNEDYDALSGTSPTISTSAGGMFSLTMSGNTTFTFQGATSGYAVGFILQLTGNGGTVTYPNSVDFAGGTAPDAPANGETDILVFITRDGGTTWYGALAIDAAA